MSLVDWTLVTVEFEPVSACRTRLTLTHSRFAQNEARDEHEQGWSGCLAKLEELWAGRLWSWTELFARPQSDRIVLRAGRPIDRRLPDYAELDDLMEIG